MTLESQEHITFLAWTAERDSGWPICLLDVTSSVGQKPQLPVSVSN